MAEGGDKEANEMEEAMIACDLGYNESLLSDDRCKSRALAGAGLCASRGKSTWIYCAIGCARGKRLAGNPIVGIHRRRQGQGWQPQEGTSNEPNI